MKKVVPLVVLDQPVLLLDYRLFGGELARKCKHCPWYTDDVGTGNCPKSDGGIRLACSVLARDHRMSELNSVFVVDTPENRAMAVAQMLEGDT